MPALGIALGNGGDQSEAVKRNTIRRRKPETGRNRKTDYPLWPSRSRRTKPTLRRGRNWYGGRRLGRLGAKTRNARQGDPCMTSTREGRFRRPFLFLAFFFVGLGV